MGRLKRQKIIKTSPRNVTTGMCPECKTFGRIFIIGQVGKERAKCGSCNQEFDVLECIHNENSRYLADSFNIFK